MSPIALYYPWMHFQDDDWLKLALLTWRRIVRIRPSETEDRDGELVRQLRAETDFIMAAAPSDSALFDVADAFSEIVNTDPDLIRRRYGVGGPSDRGIGGVEPSPEWRHYEAPVSNAPSSAIGESLPPPSTLTWIYVGEDSKMADLLRDELLGLGLAVEAPGPWVGMHPELASIYLAVLADVMAHREKLCPVTDDPRMHSAAGARDRLTELLLGDSARR